MEANIWGPKAWIFLHSITMNYPENPTSTDKQNYKNFFYSIRNILPCVICNKNYIDHLNKYPIDEHLEGKTQLVKWLIKIHNEVNKIYNKKELSYEEVMNYYEELYSEGFSLNITKNNKFLTVQRIAIPMILTIAAFYIIKKYTKLLNWKAINSLL